MAKIENLGKREGINKLAETIKSRDAKPSKTADAPSGETSPDYVLETRSLKERAQSLIDSEQFSGKDLDFLMQVTSEKVD